MDYVVFLEPFNKKVIINTYSEGYEVKESMSKLEKELESLVFYVIKSI